MTDGGERQFFYDPDQAAQARTDDLRTFSATSGCSRQIARKSLREMNTSSESSSAAAEAG